MAKLLKPLRWLYREFGFASVWDTGRDAWIIIIARATRMFAYGTNSLVLALFFSALDFSDYQIGLFMTLTLLGDVVLSIALTLVADKVGRRRVMLIGSLLMTCSGLVFVVFENFWILLGAAVVGVISATGGDYGPFRAIEESTLSHLTTPETRADVLAWYVTIASVGSAIGSEASGRFLDGLRSVDGWTLVDAYHALFLVYAGMGVVNAILILLMSPNCEIHTDSTTEENEPLLNDSRSDVGPLPQDGQPASPPLPVVDEMKPKPRFTAISDWLGARFAVISEETRSVMYKLWFLLIVDSIADGMVPLSLTNYYLDLKFKVSKSRLGDITSVSYILASVSTIFAGPLARRLGLINTMVFTHIPSSAAVLLFPLPQDLSWTVALLFLRMGLNNMDQAPRSAFIAAVVKPEETTAVMGITSMLRTLAATLGPSITGVLAGNQKFWIAFVAAGVLRLAYDFGLWAMFVNMKINQHEEEPAGSARSRSNSNRQSDEEQGIGISKPSKP